MKKIVSQRLCSSAWLEHQTLNLGVAGSNPVRAIFKMKIGLDFDGVISNCGKLKAETAKRLYGVDIPIGRFRKELIVKDGIITLEQYRNIQAQIYGTLESGLLMEPVPGVLEFLPRLQQEGHDLRIITARKENELYIAKEWMGLKGIDSIPATAVGNRVPKTEACRGLDVYIDDLLKKLKPLIGTVPHLFLFSWAYNKDIAEGDVAKRVESWAHFYEEIRRLEQI